MEYDVKIAKLETRVRVDFEKLPAAMREGVIEYGLRQLLNDAHASVAVKEGDTDSEKAAKFAEIEAAVNKRLDALMAGTYRFGSGGGGKKVGAFEKALRDLVADVLVKKGMSATDAAKEARQPQAVIRRLSEARAKADGLDGAGTEALFEKNWNAIAGKAKAIADLKQDDTDL